MIINTVKMSEKIVLMLMMMSLTMNNEYAI